MWRVNSTSLARTAPVYATNSHEFTASANIDMIKNTSVGVMLILMIDGVPFDLLSPNEIYYFRTLARRPISVAGVGASCTYALTAENVEYAVV